MLRVPHDGDSVLHSDINGLVLNYAMDSDQSSPVEFPLDHLLEAITGSTWH